MTDQILDESTQDRSSRYCVVTRTNDFGGSYDGVLTWNAFKDKAASDAYFAGSMDDGTPMLKAYSIIAEGVSEQEAVAICRSPQRQGSFVSQRLERSGKRQ